MQHAVMAKPNKNKLGGAWIGLHSPLSKVVTLAYVMQVCDGGAF